MEEQELNPDAQPTDNPDQSNSQSRADWMATASDAQVNAWQADVAKFGTVLNAHLEAEGITDPETISYVQRIFSEKAKERKASNSAEWTAVYFNDVVPAVNEWSRKSRARKILNSSDADFEKYAAERDKDRHQTQRAQLRDRVLAAEEITAAQHGKIKEAHGADVWALSDDEFRAMTAKRDAVRRAGMIERERIATDTWRIRAAEERERRAK